MTDKSFEHKDIHPEVPFEGIYYGGPHPYKDAYIEAMKIVNRGFKRAPSESEATKIDEELFDEQGSSLTTD